MDPIQKMLNDLLGQPSQEQQLPNNRTLMPTSRIAKTVLALILTLKYKDDISNSHNYKEYDGTKLPTMSGFSLMNALSTYIDHGGDKTEAIEKFIDTHLRSYEQLQELIDYLSNKLK